MGGPDGRSGNGKHGGEIRAIVAQKETCTMVVSNRMQKEARRGKQRAAGKVGARA